MIELLNTGAYLVNGIDIIPDTEEGRAELKARTGAVPCPADAAKETIAYGILKDHNVSGNMENLQIKFDKLTSHDITFVGIIQTARASGLEKFPVPYVLTNCHNSLCAVGGTINEDDHMFGLTCAKKYGGVYVPPHQAGIHQFARQSIRHPLLCPRGVGGMRTHDPRIRLPHPLRCTRNHGHGRGRTGTGKTASLQNI